MHGSDLINPQQAVDLRDIAHQLLRIALGQAAGHAQHSAFPGLLVSGHLEDGVDGLLLGGLDEPAGVDQQHLRLGRKLCQLKPVPHQELQHLLGVHAVLDTAQRNNANLHHRNRQSSLKSIKIQVILSHKPGP